MTFKNAELPDFYPQFSAAKTWLEVFSQRGMKNPAYLDPTIYQSIFSLFLSPLEKCAITEEEKVEFKILKSQYHSLFNHPVVIKTSLLIKRLFELGLSQKDLNHLQFTFSQGTSTNSSSDIQFTVRPLTDKNLYEIFDNIGNRSVCNLEQIEVLVMKEVLDQYSDIEFEMVENEEDARSKLKDNSNLIFCIVPSSEMNQHQVYVTHSDPCEIMNFEDLKVLFKSLSID